MLVPAVNNLHITAPKTYLLNNEAAGGSVFELRNTAGFGSSWAIQVGETGHEQTEVLILSGDPPAVGTLGTTTANSTFEHPADTPVYAIKFNQVVFERSTDGTAGTASPMTDGTVTYQADARQTVFDDSTGSVSYAYKSYFRNSALSAISLESDWVTPAGFSFYSLASIRDRTKNKMWDSSFLRDDLIIDDWTNEFKDKLTNAAIQANEDYSMGTVDVSFGTAGLGTITTGDFKQARRVWVTYNGNNFYQSTRMDANDDFPNRNYISTHPYHYWFGNDVFQVNPPESGGTARIMFYQMGTTMVNDTDELPRFMRGYTDGFVEYNLIQAQYKDSKISMRDKKGAENTLVRDFIGQLAPRDKTGPQTVNIVEAISGYDALP
jgi:hypothetical protein